MNLSLFSLFALKLAYEREGESPILRDDPIMSDYEREALGGVDTPLGRELRRLAADFSDARTMEQLEAPVIALKDYLKEII
nr:hypothetical protein [Pseudomonas frederiksbergensis]